MPANKEEKLSSISMHDFLDFLKLTCQVHQSITGKDQSGNANTTLDYNNLARNELVNSLLNAKAPASSSPKGGEGESSGTAVAANHSMEKKGKNLLVVSDCTRVNGQHLFERSLRHFNHHWNAFIFRIGSGGLHKRRPSQNNRKSKDNGGDDKDAVDSILMDKLAEVSGTANGKPYSKYK